jgi:hypothetical protein
MFREPIRGVCAVCAAVLANVAVPSSAPASDKPAALVAFENARYAIRAEFAVRSYGSNSATANRHRSIVQGDEVLVFFDGTDDGITAFTEDGRPVRDLEEATLLRSDGLWQKYQKGLSGQANLGPDVGRPGVLDFRCVGMTATTECLIASPLEAIDRTRGAPPDTVEYSESVDEDGLYVVEAKVRNSDQSTVWYIDPQQGFNAIRVDELYHGKIYFSALTDYRFINGIYVPVKVIYADADANVHCVNEFEYTKVNTPDIPAELTPTDIGIWIGTPVNVVDAAGARQMKWNGDQLITIEEYNDLFRQGKIQNDPRVEEWYRRAKENTLATQSAASRPSAPASQPVTFDERERALDQRLERALAPDLDEWDKYVAEFIRKYELNGEQAGTCGKILKDSKSRRDAYLQRRAADIRKLKGGKYKTDGDMKRAEEKLTVLLRPVQDTFDRMKARLMKVPTRKQLEEHTPAAAATQPTVHGR